MKRIYLAAGALLLGTSALAVAAGGDADGKQAHEPGTVTQLKSVDASKGAETNKLAWWNDAHAKMAAAGITDKTMFAGKALTAKSEASADAGDAAVQAKLAAAAAAGGGEAAETKLAMAGTNEQTGMGGPLDDAEIATADLKPRPATMNYPPCDPGPGDDRCIQLYEEGVREQLAAWNRPTGGLADHSATTAMGGPYEPVETDAVADASATIHEAMNGDGAVDLASGETVETELAHHSTVHQGVGGPVEAQSGYPPCEPGPGDDRCIQLYEPGVTGAGN